MCCVIVCFVYTGVLECPRFALRWVCWMSDTVFSPLFLRHVFSSQTAVILAVCALCVASVAASDVFIAGRENFEKGTAKWSYVGPAPTNQIVPLIFAVRQNTAQLETELMKVADPRSAHYGQHWSLDDMKAFANPAGTQMVHDFLSGAAVRAMSTSTHGEYVKVWVSVDTANKLLKTTFHTFVNREDNESTIARCGGYFLPSELAAEITTIGYTTSMPALSMTTVRFLKAESADGQATPKVISQYYQISNNTVATSESSNAVFETIGQSYEPSDLKTFDSEFGVPAQKIAKVVGNNNPTSCSENPNNCVEAELDVQVLTAIAQSTSTTFWSVPGTESFLEWAQAVASDSNPPKVFSISYGAPETDEPSSNVQAFDTEASKLGLRGVTIFVASGDDGAAGSGARGNPSGCGFNPSYPATPPHVTAVGATQGPESGEKEIACSSKTGGLITTGGGFSTVFSRPSWQNAVVSNYLKNGPNVPPTSMFNSAGRGYPDIATMGHNYPIVVGGSTYVGSGTSAATPLAAGMVTLINANRIMAGKSTLGFLNPALYQLDASAFHDITSGENNCAAGQPGQATCCKYGFTATSGWDPLTGLGSPKFPEFSAALEAL